MVVGVLGFRFLGEENQRSVLGKRCKKSVQTGMPDHIQMLPVVQPGAFQLSVVDFKTERIDQMQGGFGGQAQTADRPGIAGNFRLNQNNLEFVGHGGSGLGTNAVIETFKSRRAASPDHGKKRLRSFFSNLIQYRVQLVVRNLLPVFTVVRSLQREAAEIIHFNVVTVFSHGMRFRLSKG